MNAKKNDISKAEAASDLRVIINELLEVLSKDESKSVTYTYGYNNGVGDGAEHFKVVSKDESKSITYISGYNDGLNDVLEYLHTAHGGDTYVSKAELIGHINASIKNEGDLSDD